MRILFICYAKLYTKNPPTIACLPSLNELSSYNTRNLQPTSKRTQVYAIFVLILICRVPTDQPHLKRLQPTLVSNVLWLNCVYSYTIIKREGRSHKDLLSESVYSCSKNIKCYIKISENHVLVVMKPLLYSKGWSLVRWSCHGVGSWGQRASALSCSGGAEAL